MCSQKLTQWGILRTHKDITSNDTNFNTTYGIMKVWYIWNLTFLVVQYFLRLSKWQSGSALEHFFCTWIIIYICNPSILLAQAHGQKAVWEDPVEWVRDSLPWPSAQQDQAKLFHLPPPSTGPASPSQAGDERPHKETPPSSMESDPLVSYTNFTKNITFWTKYVFQ